MLGATQVAPTSASLSNERWNIQWISLDLNLFVVRSALLIGRRPVFCRLFSPSRRISLLCFFPFSERLVRCNSGCAESASLCQISPDTVPDRTFSGSRWISMNIYPCVINRLPRHPLKVKKSTLGLPLPRSVDNMSLGGCARTAKKSSLV